MSPKRYAHMWYCGDDVCDCSQPQILEQDARGHWRTIAEGEFHSEPSAEEIATQRKWLREKATEFQVHNLTDTLTTYPE